MAIFVRRRAGLIVGIKPPFFGTDVPRLFTSLVSTQSAEGGLLHACGLLQARTLRLLVIKCEDFGLRLCY